MLQRGRQVKIIFKRRTITTDSDGFATETITTLSPIYGWHEARMMSPTYYGAEFLNASDRFIIRKGAAPANFSSGDIVSASIIPDGNFEVTAVRDLNDRGMYYEILCRQTTDKVGG